jgi:iron complex outermembrane receptor protein
MLWTVSFSIILGFTLTPMPGTVGAQEEDEEFMLEDIFITASKRETKLMETPVSVTAFTPERIDSQGIRSIDDIARLTPGVSFGRGDFRNPVASLMSIRGVWSNAASSTTAIYLDDTPIQRRVLGAGAAGFNTYPLVFDLERVEVLRAPRGRCSAQAPWVERSATSRQNPASQITAYMPAAKWDSSTVVV